MSGTYGSNFTPLQVGSSDSGDFSQWLGRPVQIDDETYTIVQCGAAITAGGNGKQLATAISSGVPSFVVAISTGDAVSHLTVGAIPWTHTAAIASGAYFLALRDSKQHTLLTIGATTGAIIAGEALAVSTGGGLINIFTGSMLVALTGVASTSSGLGVLFSKLQNAAAIPLESMTGIVLISGSVRYRAPFRGAD